MSKTRILIVDDEPYILDVCRRILSDTYHVTLAENRKQAIEIALKEKFDLLLTDIRMLEHTVG